LTGFNTYVKPGKDTIKIQRSEIVFPAFYPAVLEDLATYITHDVLASSKEVFPATWSSPLCLPFAESATWPLLDDPAKEE
jgi:hypothetical protein